HSVHTLISIHYTHTHTAQMHTHTHTHTHTTHTHIHTHTHTDLTHTHTHTSNTHMHTCVSVYQSRETVVCVCVCVCVCVLMRFCLLNLMACPRHKQHIRELPDSLSNIKTVQNQPASQKNLPFLGQSSLPKLLELTSSRHGLRKHV